MKKLFAAAALATLVSAPVANAQAVQPLDTTTSTAIAGLPLIVIGAVFTGFILSGTTNDDDDAPSASE